MKLFSKLFCALALVSLVTACDKKGSVDTHASGTAPKLESSTLVVAPTAADSLRTVFTLRWSDPRYTVNMVTKYIVQIDSVGKNFSNPLTREVMGGNTADFIGKDLNNWMVGRGWPFSVPVSLEARVISSYSNNNERLNSNVLPVRMTPYVIPPRVAVPAGGKLFITGGDFGWNNSASMPAQELYRISTTQFGGIFQLAGGNSFLLLPTAGDWGSKYGGVGASNNSNQPNGDDFMANGSDLVTPAAAGVYKLLVDFQTGRYSWTLLTTPKTSNLWFTGDAFPDGWTNTPTAAQKLTQVNNVVFQKTMAMTPGKYYKLLNTNGAWQPQFGGSSASAGPLGVNYGATSDPDAIPTPAVAGNYTVTVNLYTMTYTVQ
jgi:hypothetical protein